MVKCVEGSGGRLYVCVCVCVCVGGVCIVCIQSETKILGVCHSRLLVPMYVVMHVCVYSFLFVCICLCLSVSLRVRVCRAPIFYIYLNCGSFPASF